MNPQTIFGLVIVGVVGTYLLYDMHKSWSGEEPKRLVKPSKYFHSDITGNYGPGWVYLSDIAMVLSALVIAYALLHIQGSWLPRLWIGGVWWAMVLGFVDEFLLSADWLGNIGGVGVLIAIVLGPLALPILVYSYLKSRRTFWKHRVEPYLKEEYPRLLEQWMMSRRC